jgi:hypothetical protein
MSLVSKYKDLNPIVVIGMHRSGTTMVTRLLSKSKVDIGNNLEGNSEPKRILIINNQLLRLYGATWDNPQPFIDSVWQNDQEVNKLVEIVIKSKAIDKGLNISKEFWGWKEPRTTITFPVWKKIFPNIKVIHVYRNPIDVVLSLYYREYKTLENRKYISMKRSIHSSIRVLNPFESISLWEIYTSLALSITKNNNGLDVCYEKLLTDSDDVLSEMSKYLSIRLNNDFKFIKSRGLAFKDNPYGIFLLPSVKKNKLAIDLGYYDSIHKS